ncbi:MAG: superoxide dismutase [Planctomycetota bacterium]|nr:superoxide dismutase [Planctomycetota bacterium]
MAYPFTLPELTYPEDALEPVIDRQTMMIHRTKHHQAYINNLNKALEPHADLHSLCGGKLCRALSTLPESIRTAVRNNGGGHWNHKAFWTMLCPASQSGAPSPALAAAIDSSLGGIEAMKTKFGTAAASRFGSGWAWIVVKADKTLAVTSTPNQDNPLMSGFVEVEGVPILGLDVWEHAYYLNYQNRRPDYVSAFWSIVNWSEVSRRFADTTV